MYAPTGPTLAMIRPRCAILGRDWAGRLMACALHKGHAGRHVSAFGAYTRPDR